MTTDPALLGVVLQRYRVTHAREVLITLAAVLAGTVGGAYVALMTQSGHSYRYSTLVGFAIAGTGVAALLAGFLVVTVARQGLSETFEVRAAGLAHTAKGRTRAWPWQAVTAVTPFHPRRSTFLTRLAILDYSCTVRFADGAKIRFSGALDGHELLEHAIRCYSTVDTQAPRR